MLLSLKWKPAARRALDFVLDLLYPPRCGGCGAVGSGVWCPACQAATVRLAPGDRAKTLALERGGELTVVSAAPYVEPLRRGIHEFKYDGVPHLARPFALLMADAWAGSGRAAGLLVPVPLHPLRARERGFNQSERLARWIGEGQAMPLDLRALRRTRNTEHQARLNAAERRHNLQGAFAADPRRCAGRSILLVDDVFTTGTTLCQCAEALYAGGASAVTALTLARAGDMTS